MYVQCIIFADHVGKITFGKYWNKADHTAVKRECDMFANLYRPSVVIM